MAWSGGFDKSLIPLAQEAVDLGKEDTETDLEFAFGQVTTELGQRYVFTRFLRNDEATGRILLPQNRLDAVVRYVEQLQIPQGSYIWVNLRMLCSYIWFGHPRRPNYFHKKVQAKYR